jgi:hypothetical protein
MSLSPQKVSMFGIGPTGPVAIAVDSNGNLRLSAGAGTGAISAFANNQGSMNNTLIGLVTATVLYGSNNAASGWDPINAGAASDAQAAFGAGDLVMNSYNFGYNGTSLDLIRIPTVFKSVSATAAGNTAVWTPAAGNKFRLMGLAISCAGTLAATGVQVIQLRDGATTVIQRANANMIQTTTVSISGGDTQIYRDLRQGIVSAAANNVLNINLGTVMATGSVTIDVWGTESLAP